jgi:hypothetical protein
VAAGLTVKVADRVLADVALIVTLVAFSTAPVLIVKAAVLLPAEISTDAGTVAIFVLLLDRVTTTPPTTAGLTNVTVPLATLPLTGALGFTVSELNDMVSARPVDKVKKKMLRPTLACSSAE